MKTSFHPFVHETFRQRIPKILDDTSRRLGGTRSTEWDALRTTLTSGPSAPLTLLVDRPENKSWNEHLQPLIAAGASLREVDTLMLENYVYRRILDSIDYWTTKEDLFRFHKEEALAQALDGSFQRVAALRSAFYAVGNLVSTSGSKTPTLTLGTLTPALLLDLWGNRADLSLSGGKVTAAPMEDQADETTLLADDISLLWSSSVFQSGASTGQEIGIVLDNCGLELCTDLVLADILLSSGVAAKVTLFAKEHPVFVSDALPKDVQTHLERLAQWQGTDRPVDMLPLLSSGKLVIKSHSFFTSGFSYEEMSREAPDLFQEFGRQNLMIFKGDANYRRLMGERQWSVTESFAKVVEYLPSSSLAIRTLKYPLSCGATEEAITQAKLKYGEKEWDCIGKCGVIHFKA